MVEMALDNQEVCQVLKCLAVSSVGQRHELGLSREVLLRVAQVSRELTGIREQVEMVCIYTYIYTCTRTHDNNTS